MLALLLLLGLAACREEDKTAAGAESQGSSDSEVALNCRRDLPDPPLAAENKARLTLTIADLGHEIVDGRNRYPHSRSFAEANGVPVTIYRGKVCVENGAECADACVSYRIQGGTTLVQANHHVATKADRDRITLHYWARDDGGNFHELNHVIETDGTRAVVAD